MKLISNQKRRNHIEVGDLVRCKQTNELFLVFYGDRHDDDRLPNRLYWTVRPETGQILDGYASLLGIEHDFELVARNNKLKLYY